MAAVTTTDSHGHYAVSVEPGTCAIDACGAVPPVGDPVSVEAGGATQHDIVCVVS
jgi:hypothetical protein